MSCFLFDNKKQGQATDIMIHAEEILKLKKLVNGLYVKHTGQKSEEIGNNLSFFCIISSLFIYF